MELTCPKCTSSHAFGDDEIFPSCDCGHVFETMPILDRAIESNQMPKKYSTKKTSPKANSDIIISTSDSITSTQVSRYIGIVASEVLIPEVVVVEELARDSKADQMHRYQEAMTKLISKIKSNAHQLGANAVIGLKFEHTVLPAGLGGPAIMVFAQGTAVLF